MSVELNAHSRNLVRLCLITQEIIEQHARHHGLDMTSLRLELLSFQHEAAFVESIQSFYPLNSPQAARAIGPDMQNLLGAIMDAETKFRVVETFSNLASTDQHLSTIFDSIPQLSQIQSLRKRMSDLNKALVDKYRASSTSVTRYSPMVTNDASMAGTLLRFSQHPFALREETFSTSTSPEGLPNHYSGPMMAAAVRWLEQTLGEEKTPNRLLKAQFLLLETLWSQTTGALQASQVSWSAEQSEESQRFAVMQDQLEEGLRDSLLRQTSPHRMVFVSSENSGKSTFINALVGKDLLPTGSGLITALPCRIIHSIGVQIPELEVNAEYWNSRLDMLRKVEGKQDKPELQRVGEDVKASLRRFEDPTFELAAKSIGDDDVQKTLRWLNHIVRLFDIFSIPFVLFANESWATISVEFPSIAGLAVEGHYELIDIPGVPENTREFHWNELIMEVVRNATAIVAIVAASQFPFRTWRFLPELIANATNLRASAVVVTMMDAVDRTSKGQKEWKQSRGDIKELFWPTYTTDLQASGLLLECSVHVGKSLNELQKILRSSNQKPKMSDIWRGPTALAMHWMYRDASSFQKQYDDQYTLDELREDVDDFIRTVGFNSTIETLNAYLTGAARSQYHDEEVRGISLRIRRLLIMINSQVIRLGLAPPDLSKIRARHEALKIEGADILTQWTSHPHDEYQALGDSIQSTAMDACDQALEIDTRIAAGQSAEYLDYETVEEIDSFVATTRAALYASLVSIQKSMTQEATNSSRSSLQARIQPIISRISDFDPQSESKLALLLRDASVEHELAEPSHPVIDVSTLTTRPSRSKGHNISFRATQERILQGITERKQGAEKKIEDLPILSRLLLATISFIPFVMKLSFNAREFHSRPLHYRLDLQGLRRVYKEVIAQPWADQLSRGLQEWLQMNEEKAQDILEKAIQAGIEASERQLLEMSKLSPTDDPIIVTGITSGYCNLIAADRALEAIVEMRKQMFLTGT